MKNISNRTKKYAEMLYYQGHRHPVIKALIVVFEILDDYTSRNGGEDGDLFLSMLGLDKADRQSLAKKSNRAFWGQGQFTSENTSEIFALIGVTDEKAKKFEGYDFIWEVFSSKGATPEEVFANMRTSMSPPGRFLLEQTYNAFSGEMTSMYYRYFKVR